MNAALDAVGFLILGGGLVGLGVHDWRHHARIAQRWDAWLPNCDFISRYCARRGGIYEVVYNFIERSYAGRIRQRGVLEIVFGIMIMYSGLYVLVIALF